MKFKRPKILNYQDTIRFHGHNGPFLALGYKLGKYIVRKHKPRGIMDIDISVKLKSEKPFTCLIDGLQCATLATYGKKNIRIIPWRYMRIEVLITKANKSYHYQISEKALAMCRDQADLELAAKKIFKTASKYLWFIKK